LSAIKSVAFLCLAAFTSAKKVVMMRVSFAALALARSLAIASVENLV
jgi:hypothetical protein